MSTPTLRHSPKPAPGDTVAVLSPSSGLPAVLPAPFELGLRRLTDDFGLTPVEYPTTRRMDASPQDRAADIHAAFADPRITAVFASIGGDDQIRVLPHLDRDLLRANPKPFFGHSDNTNLLTVLWNLGIVGYYGGSIMAHLGRPHRLAPASKEALNAALFHTGPHTLTPPDEIDTAVTGDWADPATFTREPATEPAAPWTWHNPTRLIEGPTWGGNIEILSWLLMADREILPPDAYDGCVLVLETSEELPTAPDVYRILRNMGERGLLQRFSGLLMGRAKAWDFTKPNTPEERTRYRHDQHQAVLRALTEYAPAMTAVLDIDFGHTDPQIVIPLGGTAIINAPTRQLTLTY